MKDIDQIRRENMAAIESEVGGPTIAAALVGMSQAQWSNLRAGAADSKTGKRRGMRKETARKIEKHAGKPQGWLDILHDEDANTEPGPDLKPTRDVPVVGEVKGGDDGYLEELEYPCGHGEGLIEWPTSDENAYALRVRGDSMFPRYRAGEFVIVEPSVQAPLGEDVVVCLTDGRKMLKVLNWIRDGEVQLLSINNGFAPLTISQSSIESIQYAAGRAPRSALKKL